MPHFFRLMRHFGWHPFQLVIRTGKEYEQADEEEKLEFRAHEKSSSKTRKKQFVMGLLYRKGLEKNNLTLP